MAPEPLAVCLICSGFGRGFEIGGIAVKILRALCAHSFIINTPSLQILYLPLPWTLDQALRWTCVLNSRQGKYYTLLSAHHLLVYLKPSIICAYKNITFSASNNYQVASRRTGMGSRAWLVVQQIHEDTALLYSADQVVRGHVHVMTLRFNMPMLN